MVALLGRQRDAGGVHAVVLGGVQDQRAPAAADIEQAHARLEIELAADQVELGPLRVGQRLVRAGEVRARVGHRLVEQQPVEVVGQVVVVRDRRAVAAAGVQPAAQPGLGRRRLRGRADGAEPGGRARGGQLGPRAEGDAAARAGAGQLPGPPEAVGEVALDVDVTGDVGAGQAQLPRRPQQPAQGPARADDEHRPVARAGLAAVPGPQPHRQVDPGASAGSAPARRSATVACRRSCWAWCPPARRGAARRGSPLRHRAMPCLVISARTSHVSSGRRSAVASTVRNAAGAAHATHGRGERALLPGGAA